MKKFIFPLLLAQMVGVIPTADAKKVKEKEEYFLCLVDKKDEAPKPPLPLRWRMSSKGKISGNVLNIMKMSGKVSGNKGTGVADFLLEKDLPSNPGNPTTIDFIYSGKGGKFALTPKDPNSNKGILRCEKKKKSEVLAVEGEMRKMVRVVLNMAANSKIYGCQSNLEGIAKSFGSFYSKNSKKVPDVENLLKKAGFNSSNMGDLERVCGKVKVKSLEKKKKGRMEIIGFPPLATRPGCTVSAIVDKGKFTEVTKSTKCDG